MLQSASVQKDQQCDAQHQNDEGNPEMAVGKNRFEHLSSMRWFAYPAMYRVGPDRVKAAIGKIKTCE